MRDELYTKFQLYYQTVYDYVVLALVHMVLESSLMYKPVNDSDIDGFSVCSDSCTG